MTKHTLLLMAGVAVLALMLTACSTDNRRGNGDFSQTGGCLTMKELMELIKKKGSVSLSGVVVKQECP